MIKVFEQNEGSAVELLNSTTLPSKNNFEDPGIGCDMGQRGKVRVRQVQGSGLKGVSIAGCGTKSQFGLVIPSGPSLRGLLKL